MRVDGLSKGALARYIFSNISANHTIEALFESTNRKPVADAGANQTALAGQLVVLDGSGNSLFMPGKMLWKRG